ncbi:MAG: type III-B CRISPR module RAMP protein Cmr4 [Amphritea sp.]
MSALTHRILGLLTETPLHAGSGSKDDIIDLPIQREAHTDWPCVYGSSMKGAMRCHAEQQALDKALIDTTFGPDTEHASEHAGALLVSDARLLLLPVRSLTGHFKQVTCPALLRRFLADMARSGIQRSAASIPDIAEDQALCAANPNNNVLYLEEFRFTLAQWPDGAVWADLITELLALVPGLTSDDQTRAIEQNLVLVSDDSFRHLCRSALPVQPHIRINSETKTVANGALWYEENLAPDTLLYSVIGCQPSRNPSMQMTANDLITQLMNELFSKPYLQIGGNETTGMGWCRVAVMEETSHG